MPASANAFDAVADSYERYRIGYAAELYDALEESGVRDGSRVLDIGCGTGIVAGEFTRRGCRVTGVDVSEAMLERARRGVPGATFLAGRAEALPVADGTFDAATSAQAFHWFDRAQALDEMIRVLRPGGTIAVWWKGLMRGDQTRLVREEVARELGLRPTADLLATDLSAFDRAPLEDRKLRVIPWLVRTTVSEYLGYERSRVRARDAYGDALDAYLHRLAERLGPPGADLSLSYVHLLYLGHVPA